jgi:hypothetical protein
VIDEAGLLGDREEIIPIFEAGRRIGSEELAGDAH